MVPEDIEKIISGISEGCIQSNCALTGGEMAEMGDMYKSNDFDLAGFAVGVVEKKEIIDGQNIEDGMPVYGIPSSGIHSNGFSLVRHVLTKEICEKHGISTKTLLTPTRIYVKEILSLIETKNIQGIAHITGGGLEENINRICPNGLHVKLNKSAIPKQDIFKIIQSEGNISDDEMFRVFNMGIGMCVISKTPLEESEDLIKIGTISKNENT